MSKTKGSHNIGIGFLALENNINGSGNIGIGNDALKFAVQGHNNIALGHDSGYWIKGSGNIHIGARFPIVSGDPSELDNVIAIGHGFDSYTLTNSTTQDNVILLGVNSGLTYSPKVGVGTFKPQAKLDVEGNIKVGNENNTCNADTEGSIRYDKPSKKFQGCDGTSWVNLN